MFKNLLIKMIGPLIEEKVQEKLNALLKETPDDYINMRSMTSITSSNNRSGSWKSFYNVIPLASKQGFNLGIDFKTLSNENVRYDIWNGQRITCQDFADLNETIKNMYDKDKKLFLDNHAFKDFSIILSFGYNGASQFYYWYPITDGMDTSSIYSMNDFKSVLEKILDKLENYPELKLM